MATQKFTSCPQAQRAREDRAIARALRIVDARLRGRTRHGVQVTSPAVAEQYARLLLAERPREHFLAMFLDARHQLIEAEVLFSGTIDSTEVHPREVVRRALELNAAAVLIAHNHPSGVCEPSAGDRTVTGRIMEALDLVGIQLVDHLVVGAGEAYSFRARGERFGRAL